MLVFDRIHDAMYMNKMFSTSGRKLYEIHCMNQTHSKCLLPKSYFFVVLCVKMGLVHTGIKK